LEGIYYPSTPTFAPYDLANTYISSPESIPTKSELWVDPEKTVKTNCRSRRKKLPSRPLFFQTTTLLDYTYPNTPPPKNTAQAANYWPQNGAFNQDVPKNHYHSSFLVAPLTLSQKFGLS
jgi:hypothetical protein